MTTTAYVQQYIAPFRSNGHAAYVDSIIRIYNKGGLIRRAVIAWIAVAIVTYLIAVYSLFGLSMTLTERAKTMKTLSESDTIMELSLQQKQTEFARNNEDVLQSMQKISEMKYVIPADTSVSRADAVNDARQ